MEEVAEIVAMTVFGTIAVALVVGGVLLFKCIQKRRVSNEIKTQMLTKRNFYASSLGLNLYELNNNPRMTMTIHV